MDRGFKCKITTLLEENIGKIPWDLELGEEFLDLTPLA